MKPQDLIGLAALATFFALWGLERWRPARMFPVTRRWAWVGLAFLVTSSAVFAMVPLMIPVDWLARHRWVDGRGLGVAGGAVAGYVVLSFMAYLYHRAAHRFSWLWRLHQLHHSPERVDIPGSQLVHPLEVAVFALIGVAATTLVLGLDPLAAAFTLFIANFYSLFQHCNVATPAWLGYIIQRPEAHCIHHQRGIQNFNYADLPVWDLLFGTWRNPARWNGSAGFEPVARKRFWAMLALRDVHAPVYGPGSRGTTHAGFVHDRERD